MSSRRLVIAGTGSGVGKTTLTIGLMSALRKKGYNVQGFKCGPDYIDPTYHTAVTGRISRNVDSWMLNHEMVKEIVNRGSEGADISIIEGVMGFFDGKNPTNNDGTTAEISMITKSPVVLVVNCASMARSAAAIVKGFQAFLAETNIVGVIANRVGSEGHFKIVKTAIEQECGIPVLGYLKRDNHIAIPERHLGLIPSVERGELDSFFDQLGDLVLETIDVDRLYELAQAPALEIKESQFKKRAAQTVRIAVARDAAFNFYYQENLEMLEAYGAELVEFSPLRGEVLPDHVDGLYIGGGFPEEFAEELAQQTEVKRSIQTAIENGLPTLAECGGFMFLTEAIETTHDKQYEMVGIIPGKVKMQTKLAALGYREVTGEAGNFLLDGNVKAKGHEFHYSTFHPKTEVQHAYQTKGMRGTKQEGYMKGNLIAGYTHFHFGSCPEMVENWIKQCKEIKAYG
ncbi:cobyrinate a,c-diamide synthase [Ectobacillus panaciterrae]|uniref:cobyrinate a,c-diamide synthase n=1 Tax=Ectobacillus panaciterrae TaxID=363872 RepID=UPI000426F348|nr:cobyrinate a,c-diamide synthase [Ectobacillus panaciterrae]